MRTALGLISLALAACTTNNPWFFPDDGQDGKSSTGGTSGGSATSTGTGTTDATGTAPTTGWPATDTTDTAVATSVTSTGDASSSTDPVATSSSGSSEAGDTDSSGGTTAAETSTGDSTTGEPPVEVYYALYPLCPAAETEWYAGPEINIEIACEEKGAAPEVIPRAMVKGLLNVELFDVLELAPSFELNGAVAGTFGPFALTPAQQLDAELFTGLSCATSMKMGSCDANASAWIRLNGQEWMKVSKQVKNGLVTNILIPLHKIPGVNSGEPFEVVLKADVGVAPSPEDRLWFVDPRIRPGGG